MADIIIIVYAVLSYFLGMITVIVWLETKGIYIFKKEGGRLEVVRRKKDGI